MPLKAGFFSGSPQTSPSVYSGCMNWKAMGGAVVAATLVLLIGFDFLKEASNKGGVWRGSLLLNEAHLAN